MTSGPGSVDNMKFVAAGRLDYAPVDIGALVVTRANENVPVKTVSVVHQNTMSAILSLQETGLRRPQDLVGKTLADSPASTVRVLFPLYAKKAGIDPSRVTWRDAAPPALPALLASKQVDGIGQFVVGRPLIATAAGKPVIGPPLLRLPAGPARDRDHRLGRQDPLESRRGAALRRARSTAGSSTRSTIPSRPDGS